MGSKLERETIVINCDNTESVRVLDVGFSRNMFMQSCLMFEFQIRAREISGCENRIPDYLSRWYTDPKFEILFYSSVTFTGVFS